MNLTDGNLASHLKALEANAFIEVRKEFVGRKPRTTYAATEAGKAAFKIHLDALEALLNKAKEEDY
jgi:DNA-binding PadR family transcriptional regulator